MQVAQLKTIVCLANSKKHGGMCVAGLELTSGGVAEWIRPVSSRSGHAVNTAEQTLGDGSVPRVLDVIRIGLLKPAPADYPTENWLLDPSGRWERVGRWTYADAYAELDEPGLLWVNDGSSSVGIHDRVSAADLGSLDNSIVLVVVQDATVVVSKNPWSGSTEVRLWFKYRIVQYELKITDPEYHAAYLQRGVGRYRLHPETIVTVSLAEPWAAQAGAEAYSYKVVAAIIEPED